MGNVKLNIGGGAGVAETLPTVLAACSALAGNAQAAISWEYTNTDYVKGMRICYKTDGYPANAEDGAYVDIEGAEAITTTITELTNNVLYYFRLFPYNENGDYQASITNALCECTPTAIEIVAGTATVETGITEDGTIGYAIISSSGTFSINTSEEKVFTCYLVGGGHAGLKGSTSYATETSTGNTLNKFTYGTGGRGGYVYTTEITSVAGVIEDTAIIGAAGSYKGTSLEHNGESFDCSAGSYKTGGTGGSYEAYGASGSALSTQNYVKGGNGNTGTLVPGYGYVGSSGGGGGPVNGQASTIAYYGAEGGVGAGNGVGYSQGSTAASNYGCGGGGGSSSSVGTDGMQGCIILNWAL